MKNTLVFALVALLIVAVGCAPQPQPQPAAPSQTTPVPPPPVAPVAPAPSFPFPVVPVPLPFPLPRPHHPHWMSEELGHACEKAEAEKKPVFLLFTLKSCAPCKELKAHTLTHPKVSAWLKDSAVYHEMDATEHHAAVEHYKVRAVPCYLLVDPDGTERRRGSGHVTPGAFLKWAQE